MLRFLLMTFLFFSSLGLMGQIDTTSTSEKERLDFARSYFELGGTFISSFKGKRLSDNAVTSFDHSATLNPILYWGAFHFWGHAEFYVSFPLSRLNLSSNNQTDLEFNQNSVTGVRYYP